MGGNQDATAEVAKKYGIPHYTGDLSEGIKRADAVILTTPTKMHFRQGEQVMRAGKHVLVEIPVTDSVEDAEKLVKIAKETGVIAMGGHVRRFNPSHQYVHKQIKKGELKIQQMDVQTYFFRRKNINAAGNPRSWTDHLLWHHAAHTIDLFQYQTGETISDCYAVQGPIHPQLSIAMDMGIVARSAVGRDPDAVAVVQQRRAARLVLPLHLRQRHLQGVLRRPQRRQGQQDRRVQGRRVDGRHRARGPRIHRRDQGKARAEREPASRCFPACACSASSSRSSIRSARRTRSQRTIEMPAWRRLARRPGCARIVAQSAKSVFCAMTRGLFRYRLPPKNHPERKPHAA